MSVHHGVDIRPRRISAAASVGRRALLAAAAVMASGGLGAAVWAADPPSRSDTSQLLMCTGVYALCDAAACTPIPEQKGRPGSPPETHPSHALCECVVEHGPNLGPGACSDREPRGRYILSTYSFALKEKLYLSCPAGGDRTVCFGYPCLIDEHHPDRAHCTCPIKYGGEAFLTQGGDCKVTACSKELLQGGTAKEYAAINKKFGEATHEKPPANCPPIVK
jgi:hypothetical protein